MSRILTAMAVIAATPAFAETYELSAPVSEVTLYPQGASTTRVLHADLPEGVHEIVLTGLPSGTSPDSLRIEAEGAVVGAVNLQQTRALPPVMPNPASVAAARAEVARLERSLRDFDAEVELIQAEAKTAQDMIAFLRDLARSDGAASGDIAALAETVSDRILAARKQAIDAETRAFAAAQGRENTEYELERAQARLNAVLHPGQPGGPASLVLAVEGQGTPAAIRVTAHTDSASWQPVYDLRLDSEAGALTMDRGLMVSQWSGEDWSGVTLTLSTARPSQRPAPTEVGPHMVSYYDPAERMAELVAYESLQAAPMADMASAGAPRAAAMRARVAEAAVLDFQGGTAVYRYGDPVDMRDGVDALRLKLDSRELPVDQLVAEAVPLYETTAYLVADSRNTLEEVILPGAATLYRDGALIGGTQMPLTAAGDELKLGFGAIDGILLERRVPDRSQAQGGLIRGASSSRETVVMAAENLTGRDWPLRMIDRVPVSQQDELVIEWNASVDPSESDPDGKRGVLVWEMDLPEGERQEITVTTLMRWPSGQTLRE